MSYKLGYEKDVNKFFDNMFKYGMFSKELPPIFSSMSLYEEYIEEIKSGSLIELDIYKDKTSKKLNSLSYFKTGFNNKHRLMEIPNPIGYINSNMCIFSKWDKIYEYFEVTSSYINRNKIKINVSSDNPIFDINAYDRNHLIKLEDREIIGKNYLVKTDISKFYNSIYTHSFEWIFEEHINDKKTGEIIDMAVRLNRANRTNGICIGPSMSYILGDLILFDIDKKLENYDFHRYIDDYVCYCESYEEAESFLLDLKRGLSKHGLQINASKTKIIKKSDIIQNSFSDYINGFEFKKTISSQDKNKLNTFFNGLTLFNREGGNVYKYAFYKFFSEDDKYAKNLSTDVCKYLNLKYLNYMSQYPYLIVLLKKMIDYYEINNIVAKNDLLELLSDNLNILFKSSLKSNNVDVVCWIFYYAIKYNINIYIQDNKKEIEGLNDPLIYTLLYYYAKNYGFEVIKREDFVGYCNKNKNYRGLWWLFYYEMYKEDVYKNIGDGNQHYSALKKKKISFIDMPS